MANFAGPDINAFSMEVAKEAELPIARTIPPAVSTYKLDEQHNKLEEHFAVQLRIATIENPQRSITSPISKDPLETKHVVNLSTGKVCLRFNDLNVGAGILKAEGRKPNQNLSYSSEDRTLNELYDSDNTQNIPLTYPFIFANAKNWCGINYIPPVGSKVVVGFGKANFPIILGYLNEAFKVMTPPLLPGEVCIKGWGNNYIHWKWSNKLDIVAGAQQGAQDLDDSSGGKSANADSRVKITLDGDNGTLSLTVNGTGLIIKEDGLYMQAKGQSSLSVTENFVNMQSGGSSSVGISKDSISVNTSGSYSNNGATQNRNSIDNTNPGSN